MIISTTKVKLKGDSLFFPRTKPEVVVESGPQNSGIVFTDKNGDIDLNLEPLKKTRYSSKTHFSVIENDKFEYDFNGIRHNC